VTSPLETLIDIIHTEADLLAAVGANYSFGRLASKTNNDWPRVMWVSDNGSIVDTTYVGGRLVSGESGTRQTVQRVDAANCEVQCWGEDFEAAIDLRDAVVNACLRETKGSVRFGSYRVVTETSAGADYAVSGCKIVMQLTLQVPIIMETAAQTVISSQSHAATFVAKTTGSTTSVC